MAFDEARGELLLFGDGCLWAWRGGQWVLLDCGEPPEGPGPRTGCAMAYDARREVTVLFGGLSGDLQEDTWEWNGAAWSQVDTGGAHPSARYVHAMAFDDARGETLLFGGYDGSFRDDTWTYDGAWTQHSPINQPDPRVESAAAFDRVRRKVVMYGGTGPDNAQTWVWDGNDWALVCLTGPDFEQPSLAFDPKTRLLLLQPADNSTTWAWSGDCWYDLGLAGPYAGVMGWAGTGATINLLGSRGSEGETWLLTMGGCGCPADWNGDGGVDTRDFIAFLGDWSAGRGDADRNRDGAVNTQDFLLYLNEWAAGC